MAQTTYSFDKDALFPQRLLNEILAGSLGQVLVETSPIVDLKIPTPGENLKITFVDALSGDDETALIAIVAAHPDSGVVVDPGPSPTSGSGGVAFSKSFNDGSKPYQETSDTDYVTISYYKFPGTDVITPTVCDAIISAHKNSSTSGVRIYDSDNGQTIVEDASIATSKTPIIANLGSVNNLPTGKAIFEIQIKKVSTGKPRLHSIDLS